MDEQKKMSAFEKRAAAATLEQQTTTVNKKNYIVVVVAAAVAATTISVRQSVSSFGQSSTPLPMCDGSSSVHASIRVYIPTSIRLCLRSFVRPFFYSYL